MTGLKFCNILIYLSSPALEILQTLFELRVIAISFCQLLLLAGECDGILFFDMIEVLALPN